MPDNPVYQVGDRVRLVAPRVEQQHMLGWEGEVIEARPESSTVRVRLYGPRGTRPHTEAYYLSRLELVSSLTGGTTIEHTIYRLQKRQKFYQTYKRQLPTWYAAYGD